MLRLEGNEYYQGEKKSPGNKKSFSQILKAKYSTAGKLINQTNLYSIRPDIGYPMWRRPKERKVKKAFYQI